MEYITVSQAAEKWGVTPRRVQMLCNESRIKGAVRFGPVWRIPETAVLPNSRRKEEEPQLPMPRKSPFLDMTDLYHKAGSADECAEMLINQPEAYALFNAQIAYRRGEINEVYKQARYFLAAHSGFYAVLGGGMLLFMMVSMITPLGSTIINVVLCVAGGALFAFGLGAISKVVLKKTSLV